VLFPGHRLEVPAGSAVPVAAQGSKKAARMGRTAFDLDLLCAPRGQSSRPLIQVISISMASTMRLALPSSEPGA
jgi:hypothetical protein